MKILAQRYEYISRHLNLDAYRQQMQGRNKPLKQFLPCSKALVFTGAIGKKEMVSSVVIQLADRTKCTCHSELTATDLYALYSEAIKEGENNDKV